MPDSIRVGSFNIFCNPNSMSISSSLLFASCSGVCRLVAIPVWSGRLKSRAITTLGVCCV